MAASGITGGPAENTAAHDEIRMALVEQSLYIIVVTRADIEQLRSATDFVRMTQLKMAQIIIGA